MATFQCYSVKHIFNFQVILYNFTVSFCRICLFAWFRSEWLTERNISIPTSPLSSVSLLLLCINNSSCGESSRNITYLKKQSLHIGWIISALLMETGILLYDNFPCWLLIRWWSVVTFGDRLNMVGYLQLFFKKSTNPIIFSRIDRIGRIKPRWSNNLYTEASKLLWQMKVLMAISQIVCVFVTLLHLK